MSCVVGLAHHGRVWLGGDSAANYGPQRVQYRTPKVFRRGQFLLGVVGSFRLRDILHHDMNLPRRRPRQSVENFIVSAFVEELRLTCELLKFDLPSEGIEPSEAPGSGAALVAYGGRLFVLDWDYHVGEVHDPWMALGSGAEFALGSLYTSRNEHDPYWSPELRIRAALEAAAKYTGEVQAPFRLVCSR